MVLGSVGLVPIVVSAIASMIVGMIWYSPMLFGKAWMKLSGMKKMAGKSGIGKAYAISFVTVLVMVYVLGYFISALGVNSAMAGAQIGFWAWLGFVATVMANNVIFGGKPAKLYYIDAGYQLGSMLVVGAILGMWA